MKRIVIIDHFSQLPNEPGNNRFIYLATMLCEAGFQVEIITTDFSHKTKTTRTVQAEMLGDLPYQFTMLPEPGYPKNVCLRRFYSHYIFGRNLWKYLKTMEKPDLVYVAVPSLDAGHFAAKYCRKHAIPFIVDIQDVWPEAFKLVFHVPLISDLVFAPMSITANRFYGAADRIVAVSQTYKQRGLRSNNKDPHGLCVYLGTDKERFDQSVADIAVDKPADELWVTYVGTLGHSYNIDIVIDALNVIADKIEQKVIFKVIGDGPLMGQFQTHAADCRVPVEFMGRRAYAEMVAYLAHSDIAVNPIVKGAAQSIINKHADYAMAGLPVVNTQECPEYRELISQYACGINCECENVEQVAEALKQLIDDAELRSRMGRNSRRMGEERFDRKTTYRSIVDEIAKQIGENQ